MSDISRDLEQTIMRTVSLFEHALWAEIQLMYHECDYLDSQPHKDFEMVMHTMLDSFVRNSEESASLINFEINHPGWRASWLEF